MRGLDRARGHVDWNLGVGSVAVEIAVTEPDVVVEPGLYESDGTEHFGTTVQRDAGFLDDLGGFYNTWPRLPRWGSDVERVFELRVTNQLHIGGHGTGEFTRRVLNAPKVFELVPEPGAIAHEQRAAAQGQDGEDGNEQVSQGHEDLLVGGSVDDSK